MKLRSYILEKNMHLHLLVTFLFIHDFVKYVLYDRL